MAVPNAEQQCHFRFFTRLADGDIKVQVRPADALFTPHFQCATGNFQIPVHRIPAPVQLAPETTVLHVIIKDLRVVHGKTVLAIQFKQAAVIGRLQISIDLTGGRRAPPGRNGDVVKIGTQLHLCLIIVNQQIQMCISK